MHEHHTCNGIASFNVLHCGRTHSNGRIKQGGKTLLFNHWKQYTSTTTIPMTTWLGSVVTYLEGLPFLRWHNPLIMWSCEIKWKTKTITFPIPEYPRSRYKLKTYIHYHNAAIKRGRVVSYCEGLPIMKLHDPLIMWSYRIMWQIKNVLSALQKWLKPPNVASW